MSVLSFDNVSKHYPGGVAALSAVNFSVQRGEMLFVTGASGAGKSTLLKLIHLSERPSAGAVFVDARYPGREHQSLAGSARGWSAATHCAGSARSDAAIM